MKEEEKIKERLFSVIPTSSLHMIEFLKLMNIRLVDDKETETAAVTCTSRPELLLNKQFIDKYCKTDEHLFMLVMHELYHIVLGHTQLFKRHTIIDNIAFDAIINATLCRNFPGDEYTSFFKVTNTDESFPGCILRPIGGKTPTEYIPILKRLYYTETGTYYEVYECIAQEMKYALKNSKSKFVLLGNHNDDNDDMTNPLLKEMFDDIVSKWPEGTTKDKRASGGELEDKKTEIAKAERHKEIKMRRLLLKAGVLNGNVSKSVVSVQPTQEEVTSFVPNYKDRTLLAKSITYGQPLLYNSSLNNYRALSESDIQTLVYLDVSVSVENDIKKIIPLLSRPYKNKECALFVFSTVVAPVSCKDFMEGKYKSTGATDINCIFEHYFALPKKKRSKKVLVLTGGYTGKVEDEYYRKIKEEKVGVYCGLFGCYITKCDMSNITKYFEEF